MEGNILKKLLIIMLIIMLTATNFFVLGSSIVSYAIDSSNSTNNENVEFSTFFKDEEGKKLESLTKSIKADNLKLYAEIKVKNEGYLNGSIEIENSNFNIKNNILSNFISSIEGNKINLNQINAGDIIELEFDIEPIISEKLTTEMLSKDTIVKLKGTYMETTYKGLDIEATKTINLNLKPDERTQAELATEIITNKRFSINGENKRVVQLVVKSNLTENQYPVKQTSIKVNVPQLGGKNPEEVKVLSLGTLATNGKEDTLIEDWKNENGIIEITIKNDKNETNEIKWLKDVKDELILTFIYGEDVDANIIEIESNSEIQVYNSESKYTAKHIVGIKNKELNNIITTEKQIITTEIYKGQLYENSKNVENKELPFTTTTTLEIKSTNIVDKISIKEEKDTYLTDSKTLGANTRFISTEINKEKMLEILGQDGTIQIIAGEVTNNITKDTEANENGNIVINYENTISEIEIIISNPVKPGKMEIKHQKAIIEYGYTESQLRTIKQLKIKDTVVATLGDSKIVENSTEIATDIKETITKAELIINKTNLSTMTQNTDFMIGVKLLTSNKKYDLYKNPTIKIQLPLSIQDIEIKSFDKLYGDEFEIEKAVYNKAEKTIEISLKGEQLLYADNDATQLYLQINAKLILDKTEPSKTEIITMQYTNENAIQYDGGENSGITEKTINISSPTGLVLINNTETFNIEGIKGITEQEQKVQIENKDAGKDIGFKIGLINNTGTNISNVRILGKLPTDGNKINQENTSLSTQLKNMTANGEIYYSENTDATTDISNSNNGWTSNLANLTNPKVYLIKINEINAEENFIVNYTVKLPNEINKNLNTISNYRVIYDTEIEKDIEVDSTTIMFSTPQEIKLETSISATVGKTILNNGDTVKSGEVIKYKTTVKNNGTTTIENITLKSEVPNGTVVVVPEDDYQYTESSYYKEKADIKSIEQSILKLESGKTYIYEYEVRVKSDITNGTEISNKSTAICGDISVESSELKNTLLESKIRVTIKNKLDVTDKIVEGSNIKYIVYVENLSSEVIKNLKLKILSDDKIEITYILNSDVTISGDIPEELTIEEIPANGLIFFQVAGMINEDVKELDVTATVEDEEGNTYRGNRLIDKVQNVDAKITMSSNEDNKYISIGDDVIYQITVENTGDIESNMTVISEIPKYIQILEIKIDNKTISQRINKEHTETYEDHISNSVKQIIALDKGKKASIEIHGKVITAGETFETKIVKTKSEVHSYGKLKDTSAEITHIITSNINNEELKNIITGIAWLDENQDGVRDEGEPLLSDISVMLYNISTNSLAKNSNNDIIQSQTDGNGVYTLKGIEEGEYIVLFEYDMNKYEPTIYQKEGIEENITSKAVLKNIVIDGQERTYAVTDTIKVSNNVSNINIGLREIKTFDLQLEKFISRIVVQNNKGTKSYDYENSSFEKIEINSKQLKNSIVILEYSIKVKNNGDVSGYVSNIVDYLPDGLTFNSELNPDWYLSENNLYNKSLASEKINSGEEREIKLILTKTMTENNTGLINNRAELYETYNEYGLKDINSTENNQAKDENDLGSADVIITPSTGGKTIIYALLITLNSGLIILAIYLIIKNSKRTSKVGRR